MHVIQCDAVALHNFFQYDRMSAVAAQVPTTRASDMVFWMSGPKRPTSVERPRLAVVSQRAPAGDDIVSALVQRFKLTREMATRIGAPTCQGRTHE